MAEIAEPFHRRRLAGGAYAPVECVRNIDHTSGIGSNEDFKEQFEADGLQDGTVEDSATKREEAAARVGGTSSGRQQELRDSRRFPADHSSPRSA